jgi:hypothetical protein
VAVAAAAEKNSLHNQLGGQGAATSVISNQLSVISYQLSVRKTID